jgi:hypothetical protein
MEYRARKRSTNILLHLKDFVVTKAIVIQTKKTLIETSIQSFNCFVTVIFYGLEIECV